MDYAFDRLNIVLHASVECPIDVRKLYDFFTNNLIFAE